MLYHQGHWHLLLVHGPCQELCQVPNSWLSPLPDFRSLKCLHGQHGLEALLRQSQGVFRCCIVQMFTFKHLIMILLGRSPGWSPDQLGPGSKTSVWFQQCSLPLLVLSTWRCLPSLPILLGGGSVLDSWPNNTVWVISSSPPFPSLISESEEVLKCAEQTHLGSFQVEASCLHEKDLWL